MIYADERYDNYPTIAVRPTGDRAAVMQNLNPPSDLRKMDFGSPRPPDKPYDPNHFNFGPRFGFAWTLDGKGKTVLRGGAGVLYTSHVLMWLDFLRFGSVHSTRSAVEQCGSSGSRCEVAHVQ